MTENNQIRERFLAKTRQHFFADDTTNSKTQPAARQDNNPCLYTTEQYCGQSGV